MAVETNPSSPSEMSRPALRLPVRQQQRRGAASCEPEKPSPFDDEDLVLVASPPPSTWPRIFPSL
jgi:hypothetical protein